MKKIILYTLLGAVAYWNSSCKTSKQSASQSPKEALVSSNLVLSNGQRITVNSTSTSDMDLGMGQMSSSNAATNILEVIATDNNNYSISNTLTKIKLSTDAMGQSTSYDSDKPEDKNSDMGKVMSSKLNDPDTSLVNKMTAVAIQQKKEMDKKEDAANPMEKLTDAMGMGSGDAVLESAFFVISRDKKVGDTWVDSSSEGKLKSITSYTLKSVENNMATVTMKTTITGSGETEMQGASVSFTIDTKSTGELIVDRDKSLVQKKTTSGDVTMSMDVMGQSLPISGKTNSTITYQY